MTSNAVDVDVYQSSESNQPVNAELLNSISHSLITPLIHCAVVATAPAYPNIANALDAPAVTAVAPVPIIKTPAVNRAPPQDSAFDDISELNDGSDIYFLILCSEEYVSLRLSFDYYMGYLISRWISITTGSPDEITHSSIIKYDTYLIKITGAI